ncbi:hypothetical protein SynRS9915_00413 [Synechococcus sp. RS9915]|jgi:hypothetical protein|nr:hypothetical protein SynRS9915_00413 [Synechococcus sp. RS9915]
MLDVLDSVYSFPPSVSSATSVIDFFNMSNLAHDNILH